MIQKLLNITIFAIFLVTTTVSASSISFGTVQMDSEKTVDGLNATFEIGVINTGDEPLRIEIQNEQKESLSYQYPEQNYELQATPLQERPEGQGWVNIDNEYAKLEKIPFHVEINQSKGIREFNFTTTISARKIDEETGGEDRSTQEITQQREYIHQLQSLSREIEDEPDFSDKLWNVSEINDTTRDYTEDTETLNGNQTHGETTLTNQTQKQTTEESRNTTTLILLISTLIAIIYLFKILIT